MSDQNPPILEAQLVNQGGTPSSTSFAAETGAGSPEDHASHDFMTREMQLTLGKIDPNVETLLSTVNALANQIAAIATISTRSIVRSADSLDLRGYRTELPSVTLYSRSCRRRCDSLKAEHGMPRPGRAGCFPLRWSTQRMTVRSW